MVTAVDVRYLGQSHELTVECTAATRWDEIAGSFHELHGQRNGFARPSDPIEVVAVRAIASGRPHLVWDDLPPVQPHGPDRLGEREIATADGSVVGTRWWRPGLAVGAAVVGPAVVEETEATTYLPPGSRAVVHESGALEVEW